MIFWKRMNRFCCKLVWVVHPPGAWNDQFSGQEVKGQRSRFYTRPLLGMLTSLDWHESENFFSRLRIKFLEVEYREMTLGHTHCTWTTQSIWLPDRGWLAGHPGKDGSNCLWSLVSWVACTGTVFYNALSVFSRHLFTCTLSPALTPVTQFHCTATMAYIISDCNLWCSLVMLPEASTAHDCTDCLLMCESQYSHASAAVGPPYSSVISLSRKQPWNLKPLHGRCCGHFTEAQSADCLM